MPTGVRSVGAADRAKLRGVVPGELGLRWGTGGRKRCGLGGEAVAGEQAAGEVGIGDEGHDGAATAAGALAHLGAALARVVHEHDGEVVSALELAQIGEQRAHAPPPRDAGR
jgi:hypothetical protein